MVRLLVVVVVLGLPVGSSARVGDARALQMRAAKRQTMRVKRMVEVSQLREIE